MCVIHLFAFTWGVAMIGYPDLLAYYSSITLTYVPWTKEVLQRLLLLLLCVGCFQQSNVKFISGHPRGCDDVIW